MTTPRRSDIRNVAIIAHVDHGKTTLVDALLKQSHTFRENQQVGELIMDSNPLERERGITILAKNTAISYRGIKINIIDTPGHADFSGEVERVLNMADGCLLLVDALDGPMPQTTYVLKKALLKHLKPVVVINKIDRPNARPKEVVSMVQDLFLELAQDADQLDFPIIYASGRQGRASVSLETEAKDMEPVFEAIVNHIPPPTAEPDKPFQMLVASLTYDNHLGQIGIGRIFRGKVSLGDNIAHIDRDGKVTNHKIERLWVYMGLERREVPSAEAGEIICLAGVENVSIGDTIAAQETPEALPRIEMDEPTVKMTFGVNTSTFAGREGQYCTTRQIRARLFKELQTNVSLKVDDDAENPDQFLVSGRGELHLAILIENMRREGYEFQVSRPEPVTKIVDGKIHEPNELLMIDTKEQYVGPLTENLAGRLAKMTDMRNDGQGNVHLEYSIPTRGLIGFRSIFPRITRGEGVMNSIFQSYQRMEGEVKSSRKGALVAHETGVVASYGLNIAQGRGQTFWEPGISVYEGMIVGMHPRDEDVIVNVCKEKKLTNMRAASADVLVRLEPPVKLSLEECLDFINEDELVEVTPQTIRLRKKILSGDERYRAGRDKAKVGARE
ncbi:MAG: translational GTPase TypA [Chloroflexi bacterium]|nr:translational GTPase TypA [Chloroflexota bacterium]